MVDAESNSWEFSLQRKRYCCVLEEFQFMSFCGGVQLS